jgi:hypothetical protein
MTVTKNVLATALLMSGLAWAGPGDMDEKPATTGSGSEPALWVEDAAKATSCKAGVCFKSGAATTVQVEAEKTKARFSRAALAAADGKAHTSLAWTIDAAAQLKKAAFTGNTLFVFYDMADPNSVKNQESTALYQAPVKAGKAIAVRLNLGGEDGFRAGHTYRLRIAQLLNGKEVVLAEGDFSLL